MSNVAFLLCTVKRGEHILCTHLVTEYNGLTLALTSELFDLKVQMVFKMSI